jgi:electron transport complex protein RnfB
VLDQSAVRCFQFFDICCYCEVCTGYFDPEYHDLTSAAENQMCPTGAILRTFIEEKGGRRHYEYSIDADACIGCGRCVKGCAMLNGALFLQVDQARCRNCNECAISVSCPTQAFDRLPKEQPYRLKATAMMVLRQKAKHPRHQEARDLLEQVFDE